MCAHKINMSVVSNINLKRICEHIKNGSEVDRDTLNAVLTSKKYDKPDHIKHKFLVGSLVPYYLKKRFPLPRPVKGEPIDPETKAMVRAQQDELKKTFDSIKSTAFQLAVAIRTSVIPKSKVFNILAALFAKAINDDYDFDEICAIKTRKIYLCNIEEVDPDYKLDVNDPTWIVGISKEALVQTHAALLYISYMCEQKMFSSISFDANQEIYKEVLSEMIKENKVKNGVPLIHVVNNVGMTPTNLKHYVTNKDNFDILVNALDTFVPKQSARGVKRQHEITNVNYCKVDGLMKSSKIEKCGDMFLYKHRGIIIDVFNAPGTWKERLESASATKLTIAVKYGPFEELNTMCGTFYYEDSDGTMKWIHNKKKVTKSQKTDISEMDEMLSNSDDVKNLEVILQEHGNDIDM